MFCFGHRITNILQKAFNQTKSAKDKELETTATTRAAPNVSRKGYIQELVSSDEDDGSDDDEQYEKPSPSKQVDAATTLAELPVKPKELLSTISTSKSIVKYVKLVRIFFS